MSEPPPPPPPPQSVRFTDPVCGVIVDVPEGWAPGSLKGRILSLSTPSDLSSECGACVLGAPPRRALKYFISLFSGRASVEGVRRTPYGAEARFRVAVPGTQIVFEGVVTAEEYGEGSLLRYATGSANLPDVSPFTPAPIRRAVLRSPHGEEALSLTIPRRWGVRGSVVADGVAVYEVVAPGAAVKYVGEAHGFGQPPDPLGFAEERLGIGGEYMVFPFGLPPVAGIAFARAIGTSMAGGVWGYRSYLIGSGKRWALVYMLYYAIPMAPPIWHLGAYVAEGGDALNAMLAAAAHTAWTEKYLAALSKREAAANRAAMASFRRSLATSRAMMASFRRPIHSTTPTYSTSYSSYSSHDDTGYRGSDWSSGTDDDEGYVSFAEELGREWDEIGGGGFSDYDTDSGTATFFVDSDGQVRSYEYGEEVVGAEIDSIGNILDEEGNVIGRIDNGYVYDAEGNQVGILDTGKSDDWAMELYRQNVSGAEWVFGENEFGPERVEGGDPFHVSRLYRSDDEKDE